MLQGKVCVVTGGTSDSGLETIKCMLEHGAKHVTGTYYNNTPRANKVKEMLLEQYGNRVVIIQADARTIQGNKKTFDSFERQQYLPTDCVAIDCVNINAGMFGPASYNNKHIHQIDIDKYDQVMNLNLRDTFLECNHS